MSAYYNEIDPYAAQWLKNLISAGLIAPGDVDDRSIEDVKPSDLHGYTQCHFFAGIGVWSYALRQAGWPDDRPVWTGSCPCQPFSSAGKGDGFDDERHLWPSFQWLIKECKPQLVLGEQVASSNSNSWFDLVQADLEGMDYSFGLVPFPSAGVGAPHIRDRAYWVADSNCGGFDRWTSTGRQKARTCPGVAIRSAVNGMANTECLTNDKQRSTTVLGGWPENTKQIGLGRSFNRVANSNNNRQQPGAGESGSSKSPSSRDYIGWRCASCGLPDTDGSRSTAGLSEQEQREEGNSREFNDSHCECCGESPSLGASSTSPTNGFWRDADWLLCRDGRWRPVEPGTFPLAHGIANRVGRLRAYGNAINAEAAKVFIESVMEVCGE